MVRKKVADQFRAYATDSAPRDRSKLAAQRKFRRLCHRE
jgi:hypothetical protein